MTVISLGIAAIVAIISLLIQVALVLAVLKIPGCLAKLEKILKTAERIEKALAAADKNRRAEANALIETLSGSSEEEAEV